MGSVRFCPTCLSFYTEQVEHCGIDGTHLVEADGDPLLGRTIDRYRIDERIGFGANGVVYRVTHEFLGSQHALKALFGTYGANQRVVERFRREAEAVSAMAHPNVVAITDFGTTSEGLTFLVMELLEGETLDRILRRGGPFGPGRAAKITRQLAAGLQEAHDLGYVHRDVKPANVMVTGRPDGGDRVKLLDFGIVGTMEDDRDRSITGSGRFVGTPLYMAPEQARRPDRVGPASDFYAVGVILYEMLAGRPPFDAPTVVDLVIQHAMEPVPPLEAPAELVKIVSWLLEKQPSDRPRHASEILAAIDALELDDGPRATAPPDSSRESPETLEMELDPYAEETPLFVVEDPPSVFDPAERRSGRAENGD